MRSAVNRDSEGSNPSRPAKFMPYANKENQRQYQRRWLRRRRAVWFKEHGPCKRCGSWKRLELHHVDPAKKVSHRIWSWSQQRREKELAKCEVWCHKCHSEFTRLQLMTGPEHGRETRYSKGCRCAECTEAHRIHWHTSGQARKRRIRRIRDRSSSGTSCRLLSGG